MQKHCFSYFLFLENWYIFLPKKEYFSYYNHNLFGSSTKIIHNLKIKKIFLDRKNSIRSRGSKKAYVFSICYFWNSIFGIPDGILYKIKQDRNSKKLKKESSGYLCWKLFCTKYTGTPL